MSHFSCTSVGSRSEEKAAAQVKFPLTLKLGIGFRLVSDLSKERFEMTKRLVEVFTAGCPLCDETVKLVGELACDKCEVQIYDLHYFHTTRSDMEVVVRQNPYPVRLVYNIS